MDAKNIEKEKRYTIQTKGAFKPADLEKGVDFDFISNAKKLVGVQIINTDDNEPLYDRATIEMKVDRGVYLPENTPVTLLQSSIEVEPDKRFFTLAGEFDLHSQKCHIVVKQPNSNAELIFSFLLEIDK